MAKRHASAGSDLDESATNVGEMNDQAVGDFLEDDDEGADLDEVLESGADLEDKLDDPPITEREAAAPARTEALGIAATLPGQPEIHGLVVELHLVDVAPDPDQPRKEVDDDLAESIKANGVLEPITVRVVRREDSTFFYMIVNGERRYRGSLKAQRTTIPARVVEDEDRGDRLLHQVVFNDGKRLAPMEEARAWKRILDAKGWKLQQLAKALGRPKSTVSDRLALLDAPAPFQKLFADGTLSPAAAIVVREYRDVPEAMLRSAVADLCDGLWYDYTQFGGTVPVDDVRRGLENMIIAGRLKEIAKPLAAEYSGPTAKIKGKSYAVDAEAYRAIELKHAPPASAKESAESDRWQRESQERQRKERQALEAKRALRNAQFAALNEKLPVTLNEQWASFLVRWMVKEIQKDDLRQACKALNVQAPKTAHGGLAYDKAIVDYSKGRGGPGLTKLALQLLLSRDLSISSYDKSAAQRFGEAAKLLKVDLAKVKVVEAKVQPPAAKAPAAKPAAKKPAKVVKAKPSKKARR